MEINDCWILNVHQLTGVLEEIMLLSLQLPFKVALVIFTVTFLAMTTVHFQAVPHRLFAFTSTG